MPKYYCDYCDTYLTHDSPSVRKTHCNGRKHKENVKFYYQKWMEDQAQNLIDATTAAFKAGKMGPKPPGVLPPPIPAAIAGRFPPPLAPPGSGFQINPLVPPPPLGDFRLNRGQLPLPVSGMLNMPPPMAGLRPPGIPPPAMSLANLRPPQTMQSSQ